MIYNVYTLPIMNTTIAKWGNSLAVRIPKELISSLHLSEGVAIGFQKVGDKIVISTNRPRSTLDDLTKNFSKKNQHKLVFPDDSPRGQEIW